ncbi:MAG: hypothetical protein NT159_19315 [Proteobacteria bacterium]|nr:hypothetical protein [Pseudomonadota bacterium]
MRELFQRDVDRFEESEGGAYIAARLSQVMECLKRGHQLFETGNFEESRDVYLDGLCHLGELPSDSDERMCRSIGAELSSSLADCHANLGDFGWALDATDRAIRLLSVAEQDSNGTRRLCAARDRRAFYLAWMGRCDNAAVESEGVIASLRSLVVTDADALSDLARSLDHRAEILERAHRLLESLEAAEESSAIRRELAISNSQFRIPLLRSLVTAARITGTLGNSARAVALCEQAMEWLTGDGGNTPKDLRAQFATCLGRHLMQLGRHEDGEKQLIVGAELFRSMVRENPGASVFRDAYAEVMGDLGLLHLETDPVRARHWLLRGAAQKRRLVHDDPHPLHKAGLAEAMVRLGLADLGSTRGEAAMRNFDRALQMFERLERLIAGFPSIAVALSSGLIAAATSDSDLANYYHRISRLVARDTDLVDDAYQEAVHVHEDAFHRLWLKHFIDHEDGNLVVSLLAIAHGRRLGQLAQAELTARDHDGMLGEEEVTLLNLRRQIRRLDLEMAEILSARSPSLIQRDHIGDSAAVVSGSINAVKGAGTSLDRERDHLFRDYVNLRDRLVAEDRYPNFDEVPIGTAELRLRLAVDSAIAIWCIPQAFEVDRPPFIIVIAAGTDTLQTLAMPELGEAGRTFSQLLASWHFGRSGLRLGSTLRPHPPLGSDPYALEEELHGHLEAIWGRIARSLSPIGITHLDMVTHAEAHNLPWLGTCPGNLRLRQFPSLHFYHRSDRLAATDPPSPERPLMLMTDRGADDDLAHLLYFVPMEIEAIRQVWPGAVIDAADPRDEEVKDVAVVWMVGHGLTRRGHPMIGRNFDQQPLANANFFRQTGHHTGLLYASTCYLGQTTDVDGEPVGLPSLAALLPEAPYAAGSSAPVDDLGAALLAMLFHVLWKQAGDARIAFDLACAALRTGVWPDRAKHMFRDVCTVALPSILDRAARNASISREAVIRLHPELSKKEAHERQFLIRRQARHSLALWQAGSVRHDLAGNLDMLVDSFLRRSTSPQPSLSRFSQTTSAANYWAWFG